MPELRLGLGPRSVAGLLLLSSFIVLYVLIGERERDLFSPPGRGELLGAILTSYEWSVDAVSDVI